MTVTWSSSRRARWRRGRRQRQRSRRPCTGGRVSTCCRWPRPGIKGTTGPWHEPSLVPLSRSQCPHSHRMSGLLNIVLPQVLTNLGFSPLRNCMFIILYKTTTVNPPKMAEWKKHIFPEFLLISCLMQWRSIAENSYRSFLQYLCATLWGYLSLYIYLSSINCTVFRGVTIYYTVSICLVNAASLQDTPYCISFHLGCQLWYMIKDWQNSITTQNTLNILNIDKYDIQETPLVMIFSGSWKSYCDIHILL